jgi:predicted RNA-binding protein with PIN domain
MEIIIDGYNVIGSDTGLTGNLEHRRNLLVQHLASYRKNKGHDITVVFDGWRSGSIDEVQQKRDGICIVYSRLGEKADSVIVRLARKQGAGCVVVTSDREIRSAIERFGAAALYAGEFGEMLRTPGEPFDDQEPDYSQQRTPKKGNPRRLSKKERRRREKLNKLKS